LLWVAYHAQVFFSAETIDQIQRFFSL
jgi:hypothetical protein